MLNFFIRRKVATSMIFMGIILLGIISLSKIPITLLPRMVIPKLIVITQYPFVSAGEIDNLITATLESTISSVNGVTSMTSRSEEGLSVIYVDLSWDYDIDMAILSIRQKLDLVRNLLPQDAQRPVILKYDPDNEPVIKLLLKPESVDFFQLRDFLDKNVKPDLERIPGVASVVIHGGEKREIKIQVDSKELFAVKSSLNQVGDIVGGSNYNFPAGNVSDQNIEYTIRTIGEYNSLDSIRKAVIGLSQNGVPVSLEQISEVKDGYKEKTGTTLYNGEESIIVGLHKEPDKNTIEVSSEIRQKIDLLKSKYKGLFEIKIINDESIFIQRAVNNVRNEAIVGSVIAFLILLIFLRSVKFATIILISIPVAIISTFIMMYLSSISINIISMGGLALGVGMLVDNSIVVLESVEIELQKARKGDQIKAIISGVQKVVKSNIASTMTSILVFFPIIFIKGIAAELFGDLALTITFSLLSSLICSITLAPMLLTIQFKSSSNRKKKYTENEIMLKRYFHLLMNKLWLFSDILIDKLKEAYNSSVFFTLNHIKFSVIVSLIMITVGIASITFIPRSIFPAAKTNLFEGYVEIEPGSSLESTVEFAKKFDRFLKSNQLSETTIMKIGHDEDNIYDLINGRKKENYIQIKLYQPHASNYSPDEYLKKIKSYLISKDNISYSFRQKGDFLESLLNASQDTIQIKIASNNDISNKLINNLFLKKIDNSRSEILAIESASTQKTPEIQANPDLKKMASFGLQVKDIASLLKTSIDGNISSYYRQNDREIPIRVQIAENNRNSIHLLEDLFIQTPSENYIRLGQIVNFKENQSRSAIFRSNGEKMDLINVHYHPGTKDVLLNYLTKVKKDIESEVNQSRLLSGEIPQIIIEDSSKETLDSLQELIYTFLLSIILIYMLIAAQFESYIHPFSIAMSIPMVLPLVSLSLFLTGNTISIISGMGMIMLAGLAVNNAIVLYEFIEYYRSTHHSKLTIENFIKLIQQAGKERIRPLTLTTLTTILGMGPMAMGIGTGAEMQAPLAIVVFFGVLGSSVLTIVFFPVYYTLFEKLKSNLFLPKSSVLKNK